MHNSVKVSQEKTPPPHQNGNRGGTGTQPRRTTPTRASPARGAPAATAAHAAGPPRGDTAETMTKPKQPHRALDACPTAASPHGTPDYRPTGWTDRPRRHEGNRGRLAPAPPPPPAPLPPPHIYPPPTNASASCTPPQTVATAANNAETPPANVLGVRTARAFLPLWLGRVVHIVVAHGGGVKVVRRHDAVIVLLVTHRVGASGGAARRPAGGGAEGLAAKEADRAAGRTTHTRAQGGWGNKEGERSARMFGYKGEQGA